MGIARVWELVGRVCRSQWHSAPNTGESNRDIAVSRALGYVSSRRRLLAAATVAVLGVTGLAIVPTRSAAPASPAASAEYVVVYQAGTDPAAARQAIVAAGGTVVSENTAVGVATVRADGRFVAKAEADRAVIYGVTRDRVIGREPGTERKPAWQAIEQETSSGASSRSTRATAASAADPLSDLQWGNKLVGATVDGSYRRQQSNHRVRVGIMDSGLDASHPDIAPNFDRRLSRNFTVDMPELDGPCEYDNCVDPADVDQHGHGTHVGGIIAAAINNIGTAGVAPRADLVNIRAGQDSGYFFLKPVVDALTYAADVGIDAVNMSFFIDRWLFNCTANPADTAEEQAEQRTTIEAMTRAANYAHRRGVTMIAAAGNESTDLGHPTVDTTSPDLPWDTPRTRTIDDNCLTLPSEAPNILDVSAVGPVNTAASPYPRKSFYSNYGQQQIRVAAPGGDSREFYGTPRYNAPETRILAPYPLAAAIACGEVDENGVPNGNTTCFGDTTVRPTPLERNCANGVCALYQWAQGTSMASPFAVGVVAIIIAQLGRPDPVHGGLTMDPDRVARVLAATAVATPCPEQEPYVYPDAPGVWDATCTGTKEFNDFYGYGVISAQRAATAR